MRSWISASARSCSRKEASASLICPRSSWVRTAEAISSTVVGLTILLTTIGLSWLTSFTTKDNPAGCAGDRITRHTDRPNVMTKPITPKMNARLPASRSREGGRAVGVSLVVN